MAGIHSVDRLFPFVKLGVTATGAAQNIAHGLGVIPDFVILIPHTLPTTQTLGSHTSTNIVVTLNAGVIFDVLAGVKG